MININKDELEEIKKNFPPYSGIIGNRFQDMSGQKIGKISILYRGKNDTSDKKHRPMYVCKCDCGNILLMRGDNLKQRPNSSCGHCKEFSFNQKTEYGNFKILEIYNSKEDNNRIHVKIQCKTCNAILHPRRSELYTENNIICPHCNRTTHKIGNKIGKLTLLDFKIFDPNIGIQWKCQCDCGKIVFLTGLQLRSRRTCGEHDNPEDIIGKKFGKLIVVKNLNYFKGGNRYYLCQCECGGIAEVPRNNLISGHTLSCGCIRSKNEEKIAKMLIENNISFYKNFTLKNNTRADFYIKNKYILEYDGYQHFSSTGGWNTPQHLEKVHRRDLNKNKYCFDNNIPLIRIPYNATYTIDDLKLETTRFLLTPENEEEYYK